MFDNPTIDVALGLIFVYVVLSLVCSAVQEWVASLVGLRSKNLRRGIDNLVGDEQGKQVYEHSLIKRLHLPGKLPSYITPQTFSTVLLEVVARDTQKKSLAETAAEGARDFVDRIPDNHPLKETLQGLVGTAEGNVEVLREKLALWFDEGMDRISGWYKRRVKLYLFLISTVVVVLLNASTVYVAESLWSNDEQRAKLAAVATEAARTGQPAAGETELGELPIGWGEVGQTELKDPTWWFRSLIGWLFTTAAVSLGAPFWFDLLGKVSSLRGSGAPPAKPQTS